jgi:phosphoribosylformylglycinamidine cyclo-ligase
VYDELLPDLGKKRKTGRVSKAAGAGAPQPTLGEVLLTPTRIYAESIVRLQRSYKVKNVITGMANITGSGLAENLVRSIPPDCDAIIDRKSWTVPPVFKFLQKHGNIEDAEMKRVFNLGIGYCVIVKRAFAESVKEQLEKLGEKVFTIGEVVKGKGRVLD